MMNLSSEGTGYVFHVKCGILLLKGDHCQCHVLLVLWCLDAHIILPMNFR